jgi:two-component system, cell cycle response regulator
MLGLVARPELNLVWCALRGIVRLTEHRDDDQKSSPSQLMVEHTMTVTRQMSMPGPRAVSRRAPSLVVVSGSLLGTIFRLEDALTSIGRDAVNTIAVNDAGVSRRHAVIERYDERVVVRDLGSKNGTYVNDDEVRERELSDGDLVYVGHGTYKFLSGDSAEHGYYEDLHDVASKDKLTDIPNRRYFDEALEREVGRVGRHGGAVTLMLLDLDHFKAVNDTYGHVFGDAVLRQFAGILKGRLRANDFCARYGGEEFAIILTDTRVEQARQLAESVRGLCEAHMYAEGETTALVTTSIGGAMWSSEMEGPKALIEAADAKLYEAKTGGRNRVAL